MNSYFDDDAQTAQGSTGGDLNASATSNLDKGTVDTDLSKLFNQGGNVPEKVAPATLSDNAVVSTTSDEKEKAGPVIDTGADLTIDKPFETKTDDQNWNKMPKSSPDDSPKKSETAIPTPSSTSGSLAKTEDKLNSRKNELTEQITEIEGKLKKVDETIEKIAGIKQQEADILKVAEEI
ncbi:MAG: hypothetical protein Q7S80_00455 [bacterium]|nr:hypothetical protein [bacterium]